MMLCNDIGCDKAQDRKERLIGIEVEAKSIEEEDPATHLLDDHQSRQAQRVELAQATARPAILPQRGSVFQPTPTVDEVQGRIRAQYRS